ncbi:MAG: MFS transporter [Cyanobacteriota bacterium]|nr:MFS transporter [Cyanobacteriota bacterium]
MTTTTPPLSFQDQLDESKITRPMWLLWILSAGLIALDGFDFFIIGVAMPFIQRDFGLSVTQTGAIAVAAVAGALVGSGTLGPVTDKVGRQLMLAIDVGIFIIASAATALAWNATSLIIFRFLVGVGIGADYPISVSYITENVPARFRGRMVISAFSFQAVGALVGAIVGFGIMEIFNHLYPDSIEVTVRYAWRLMLGVGVLFALVIGLLRLLFTIESPMYYLSQGDYEAASDAATQILVRPVEITPETDPPTQEPRLSYKALFSPRYLRRTILASVPWFLQDIATYGMGIFTPTIIAAIAFTEDTHLMVREIAAAKGAAFVDVFLIVGFLLAIAAIGRFGRIELQMVGFVGMAVGLVMLSQAGGELEGGPPNLFLLFGGFIVFNVMMNMGPNSTTFLLSGEVFSTAIRASGAGFSAAFAKAGAVLGTFGLPIVQKALGVSNLLIGLASICILAAVATYLFRVDTVGRLLEDVDTPENLNAPSLTLTDTLVKGQAKNQK